MDKYQRKEAEQCFLDENPVFHRFTLQCFQPFACPIAMAEVMVREHVVEENDDSELMVLRLYSLGFHDAKLIASLSGMALDMIEQVISNEKNLYGQIDLTSGELTEAGILTLKENAGGRFIRHAMYLTSRKLQIDGITGTILPKALEVFPERMSRVKKDEWPGIPPKEQFIKDEEFQRELWERLGQYRKERSKEESEYQDSIEAIQMTQMMFRDSVLLCFAELKYPILLLGEPMPEKEGLSPGKNEDPPKPHWVMYAAAQSDAAVLQKKGVNCSGIRIRKDEFFEYLLSELPSLTENEKQETDEVPQAEIEEQKADEVPQAEIEEQKADEVPQTENKSEELTETEITEKPENPEEEPAAREEG